MRAHAGAGSEGSDRPGGARTQTGSESGFRVGGWGQCPGRDLAVHVCAPIRRAACQTGGYLPILTPRLANMYDITMTTVTRRAKPSWAGNSGIPEDPLDSEDDVDDVPVVCGVVEVVELLEEVDGVVEVVEVVDEVEVNDEGVITETEFEP